MYPAGWLRLKSANMTGGTVARGRDQEGERIWDLVAEREDQGPGNKAGCVRAFLHSAGTSYCIWEWEWEFCPLCSVRPCIFLNKLD